MRTIFAMGGGGFTMEPDNTVLDEYILGLARRPVPRVCFLPTASGDPLDHITRFHEAFSDLPCEPTDLSLFRLGGRPVDLRTLLHPRVPRDPLSIATRRSPRCRFSALRCPGCGAISRCRPTSRIRRCSA